MRVRIMRISMRRRVRIRMIRMRRGRIRGRMGRRMMSIG